MNSGSSQEIQEEAWAEVRVVEGQRMAEGMLLIAGMATSTCCLLTGAPEIVLALLQGWLHVHHLQKTFLSLRNWE